METPRAMKPHPPPAVSARARTFPAHPSALYRIRRFLRESVADSGLERAATDDLVLAVSEACANSLQHTATVDIRVTSTILPDRVEVEVEDDGLFGRRIPIPELEVEGGHGTPLMMALMDEVQIRKGTRLHPGTVVRLTKYRGT